MAGSRPSTLPFTDDEDANRFLAESSFALLVGMLLDQQYPMEAAFRGPYTLSRRIGPYDASSIAAMDPDALETAFRERPALHRYPGSMAQRTHKLATHIVEDYDGDPDRIWDEAGDGDDLYRRLRRLPGFGEQKARIFVGVLGKRLGAAPPGWEKVAADWPSIADVDHFDKVEELRNLKREMRGSTKGSAKRPAKAREASK